MLPIRTILHPTDFSDCSRYAFQLAATTAREQGARLVVLHVDPKLGPLPAYEDVLAPLSPREYRAWLWKVLNQFDADDPRVTVEHRVEEGDPVRGILRAAAETGCDLIVMGTHGRTGLQRLILGSVAEQVLRKAPCPVVTVKLPQHATLSLRAQPPARRPEELAAALPGSLP